MKSRSLRYLLLSAAVSLCSWPLASGAAPPTTSTATPSTTVPATPLQCAATVVHRWTNLALAREVVVVAAQATSTPIMRQAASMGFGGIIIFGLAPAPDFTATLRGLTALVPTHLSMAVMSDDEGGGVIRVPSLVGTWPWPQVMTTSMSTAQIRATGVRVGTAMRRAGMTMDLAPVADVDGRAVWPSGTNPDGLRSFGGSPTRDAVAATAFAQGLADAGVVATMKHFPGLGYASGNTDNGAARTLPWSQLQTTGLIPFRAGIAAHVGAIMMSNAIVPGLTSGPAGLASAAIRALRSMGFAGLIITDSLGAGAIGALHLSPAQAGVIALRAGVDEILGGAPTTPQSGISTANDIANAIVTALATNQLSRATLEQAAAQVVASANPGLCAAG